MNSKLRKVLKSIDKMTTTRVQREPTAEDTYIIDMRTRLEDSVIAEAEKAIRQAVGEEMLELKPNNPYKTTDGQVPESFEAPAHAYDVANSDWEQKIKQWQGGEDA